MVKELDYQLSITSAMLPPQGLAQEALCMRLLKHPFIILMVLHG